MGLIFKDQLHDEFGTLPLAYIPYGGADFGEVAAVGLAVGDGDDSAFYDAWVGAAKRLAGEAQRSRTGDEGPALASYSSGRVAFMGYPTVRCLEGPSILASSSHSASRSMPSTRVSRCATLRRSRCVSRSNATRCRPISFPPSAMKQLCGPC